MMYMVRKIYSTVLVLFAFFVLTSCSSSSLTHIETSNVVSFMENNKTYQAKLYKPNTITDKTPIVLIIHEWWGATEYVHRRGKMLQEAGIAALVIDLYGDNKIADNPEVAKNLATKFYEDSALGVGLIKKYIASLKEAKLVSTKKIYLAGYCFGGTQSLNYVRLVHDEVLKGVFSFHGGLKSDITKGLKKISTPVYVFNGDADPLVPKKDIDAFKKEMKNKKAKLTFFNYVGAMHAFSNPEATETGKKYSLPVAYDEVADKDSWEQMLKVLKEVSIN